MADKSHQLVLDALQRALAEPAGMPLHAHNKTAGMFATTAPARKAALFCKDQGYVRTLRTEARGRTTQEICAVTEEGLAFLLRETSPRQVLENLVHALEVGRTQLDELVDHARQMQTGLDSLQATAVKVLHEIQQQPATMPLPFDKATANGHAADETQQAILSELRRWQSSGALEDCPLPHLYRSACQPLPSLTIGQFHDALRRLQECLQVYLHPWTGPLYEIPEPALALMAGHEIAYYASLRNGAA